MSGTTEGLRRKIEGAQDLNGVVRSMKALAASSIGQYERAAESLDLYYRTIELGLSVCFRVADSNESRAVSARVDGTPVGAVVFGSDQGLVGQFNEKLLEFAMNGLNAVHGKTVKIWAVGERIQALLTGGSLVPADLLPVPISVYGITALVGRILVEIEAARERGDVAQIYLFHNRSKSGAAFEPVMRRLLPLDSVWRNSLAVLPWPTKNLPEVIEMGQPLVSAFISGYLFVLLFQACAESLASENACRLAAMQRAEKNIREVLENLRGTFRRIRQESIDEELFDVISGYEALSCNVGKNRHHGSFACRPEIGL